MKKKWYHENPIQALKDATKTTDDIIVLPKEFAQTLCDQIAYLQEELNKSHENEIWGFYGELYPIYTSRKDAHPDLGEPMTVSEANWMVEQLKMMKFLEDKKDIGA